MTPDEQLSKRIGTNARVMRKRMGLTLAEVAERSGLTKSYVWELERGEGTNPSIHKLMALVGGLGCTLDGLVGSNTNAEPQLRPEAMRIAVEVDTLLRNANGVFNRGKDAFYENRPENPYPEATELGRQWRAGFDAGNEELANDPDVLEALTRHG